MQIELLKIVIPTVIVMIGGVILGIAKINSSNNRELVKSQGTAISELGKKVNGIKDDHADDLKDIRRESGKYRVAITSIKKDIGFIKDNQKKIDESMGNLHQKIETSQETYINIIEEMNQTVVALFSKFGVDERQEERKTIKPASF